MDATMIKHVTLNCACGQPLQGWRYLPNPRVWAIGEPDTEISALTAWAADVTDVMEWGAAYDTPVTAHDVQDSTGWVLSYGACGQ